MLSDSRKESPRGSVLLKAVWREKQVHPAWGTRNTQKEQVTRKPPAALRVLSSGGGEDLKAAS